MKTPIRTLGSALTIAALAAAAVTAQSPGRFPDGRPVVGVSVSAEVGAAEPVMVWRRDSCRASNGLDLPDVQARAMRRNDGSIVLYSGNAPVSYSMTGPDFDRLTRDCSPNLVSADLPYAHTFAHQEWLLAFWKEAGFVHALVHNEFHDPVAPNCRPGVSDTSNLCWQNSITYARSIDDGRTFLQAAAPWRVAAALPEPWDPAKGAPRPGSPPPPHGYFTPSNIVAGGDDYYYSLFFSIPDPLRPAERGVCLMRTNDLGDAARWRAWDGRGFNLTMGSPYDISGAPAPTGLPPCSFVDQRTIGDLHGSLTWNEALGRWLLVGSGARPVDRQTVCGTYFSTSTDLLRWSEPQLLLSGKLPHPPCAQPGDPNGSLIYPSLIDHASTSPNFETTGETPHLYYVRWNQGLDRDLLRAPVRFRARAAATNAASFAGEAVAAGLLVTLFGENLGPAAGVYGAVAGGELATAAGGVRVLFDGTPAPVVWAQAGQVNVVVPYAVAGRQRVSIEVERDGRKSRPVEAAVVEAVPGLFALGGGGVGPAAALNLPDHSVNSAANPVERGGFLALYATFGAPTGADGAVATGPKTHPWPVEVEIGGAAGEVVYAGDAPGLVSGAVQVNVRVPGAAPAGPAVPVVLRVRGARSQPGVTIAVR